MATSEEHPAVRLERRDGVGVILIDNPPINAASEEVRRGLLDAIRALDGDPTLASAVIIGAGKMFMAGADIREFGAPLEEPQLPAIVAAIEASRKPFIAAIAGAALGGGYELSLGCDFRIATPDAVVGLPETTLGIIPGAGGTQRLPRLVGCEKAIELICSGARVKAEEAARLGMIDAVACGDLLGEAIHTARQLTEKRRIADRPVPAVDEAGLEKTKAAALKVGKFRPHIRSAIAAVESCRHLDVARALAGERAEFERLRASREAAALRHLFFAERSAGKAADLKGVAAKDVQRVAVIGGGTMGSGIACALLDAGKFVVMHEQTAEAAGAAEARLRRILQGRVDRGRITQNAMDDTLLRFSIQTDFANLATADAIIEAVFEDLQVKQDLFAELGRTARTDAVLFTNTSYLSVAQIAESSGRPQDVAGLHFFTPAEVMRLVEVVRHPRAAPVTIATGISLAKSAGKLPILANDSFGFIGNRIYAAYRRQCEFMLEEGALPAQIDSALEDFGFAMGPYAVSDMTGLDIAWRMRKATAGTRNPAHRYVRIPDVLCEMGRFGKKLGAGYYRYDDRGNRQSDPVVTQLIEQASAQAGRERRHIEPQEIVERALAAMASEAALLIAEGVAANPADLDLVLTHGYGFPRHEGGIVFWAQNQLKADLEKAFRRLSASGGPCFETGSIAALRND